MVLLCLLIITIHFLACIKNPAYGIGILFLVRILIPESVRISSSMSLNTGMIIVLMLFMIKNFSIPALLRSSLVRTYAAFAGVSLTALLLANYEDLRFQFVAWAQFVITNLLPGILVGYFVKTKESMLIIVKSVLVAIGISCCWGVLSFVIGSNPYVDLFVSAEQMESTGGFVDFRGIQGSSGTFISVNAFGYFLPITLVILLFLKKNTNIWMINALSVLVVFCILLSTKRSALVALFVLAIAYIYYLPSFAVKVRAFTTLGILTLLTLISIEVIPSLQNAKGLLESSIFFWDDSVASKNDIGGSSFEMRIVQWLYPFVEVKDNILFGKGFGWTALYLSKYPYHPILYGFETIIADAIVNMGVLGLFLWCFMFWRSYCFSVENDTDTRLYKIFTITQIAIAVATGFSYVFFYGLYIAMLNKLYLLKGKNA